MTRWIVICVAVIVAVVLIAGMLRFAFGWLGAAAEVVGPDNVRAQYAKVIEDWNSLEAAAANVCAASSSDSKQGPVLLEDPVFAYKATYRRIAVDYNRRQANIFEARLVGPKGYPREAPSLPDMKLRVC